MQITTISEPETKNLEPLQAATEAAIGRAISLRAADAEMQMLGLRGNPRYYTVSPCVREAQTLGSEMTQLLWLAQRFAEINTNAIVEGGADIKAAVGAKVKSALPPVVMARLSEENVQITVHDTEGRAGRFTSSVPVPPIAISRQLAVVREACPDVSLHIAFEANWKPAPQGDPVVIARILNRDYKIAEWGGDADLVAEFYTNA